MRNSLTMPDLWQLSGDFVPDTAAGAASVWSLSYDYKHTYALAIDGVGDRLNPFSPLLVVTTDTVPDDTSSTATLTVDAPHTISTIDTVGDQDFYSVTLTAGVHYQIGMYGYTGGPGGTPLADSYVEIYDADGNLVTSGDGGADTAANAVNSGFDVLLDFIPTASGTYYIDARAFDNVPTDGTNGDLVGDYELFVQNAPPGAYEPYYDADSPLYAIDWGTRVNRVNQTAANPDGDEGPRPTGNPQGTPQPGSNVDITALAAAQGVDITGKNVITIYFARAGEIVTSLEDPSNPGLPPVAVQTSDVSDFEHNAVMTALNEFAKVADVVYLEVPSLDQADFEYASYKGTPGPGVSLLGSMEPPDEPNEGLALFNSGDYRWNATDLQQGGFSFVTLIHEIGHGHGLAHPHDNGGHSGIMRGVEPEGAGVADYTTGDYELNQGVFTMMSYEDGWQSSPYGNAPTTGGFGYLGGLMAFDIAAIQDKYGVNEDYHTGNDVYTLKDVNAPGTYFTCIWDAGGTDSIVYDGVRDATIDLRAATLKYEAGGGGRVSYAYGIFGGFTIANAVTIENASGGSGNDTLTGNNVGNVLTGGAGNDYLLGLGGNDTLIGGAGADRMSGGLGDDLYYVENAGDTVYDVGGSDTVMTWVDFTLPANVENLWLTNAAGLTGNGNALDNNISGGSHDDTINGFGGNDRLVGGGGNDTIAGGDGNDNVLGGGGNDYLNGGTGNDMLRGEAGDDTLFGGPGDDVLIGGAGHDDLTGAAGADTFVFLDGDSSADHAQADKIWYYDHSQSDVIDLHYMDANANVGGNQAFTFIGTAAFSAAGQLHYGTGPGQTWIEGDLNGDGLADFALQLSGVQALTADDFVL